MQTTSIMESSSDEDEVVDHSIPPPGVENTKKRREVLQNQYYSGQIVVFDMYQRNSTQYFVAFIIILNFVVQCWKRSTDPACAWEDTAEACYNEPLWEFFGWFFNIVFLLELMFNAAGSWLCPLWQDPWNRFDMVVVALGVLDMTGVELGKLKLLRMLRAFRIFRLFNRVPALRKVTESLFNALSGVANAFLIVIIIMCLYAVLAVDIFGNVMCDEAGMDYQKDFHGEVCFGRGYYGDFTTSLYTMFQVLTGESWSEGCVWPLLDYFQFTGEPLARIGTMVFFVSFILITNFVLLNVVVAVLLDGMAQVPEEHPEDKEEDSAEKAVDFKAQLDSIQKSLDELRKVASV